MKVSISKGYFSIFLVCLVGVVLMLTAEFFPICDEGQGTNLSCSIGTGMVARVDGPAKIHIFDDEKFSVMYYVDGELVKKSSIHLDIFHTLDITTSESMEVYMSRYVGKSILPLIRVDTIDGKQYPSLVVSRTHHQPLVQLFQWYLFPVFLMPLIGSIFFLLFSIKIQKNNKFEERK